MLDPQCYEAPSSLDDGSGLFSSRDGPLDGLVIGTKRKLTRCGSHLEPLDNRRWVDVRETKTGIKAGEFIKYGQPTGAAVVECWFPLENRTGLDNWSTEYGCTVSGMETGRRWRFAFWTSGWGIRVWLMESSGFSVDSGTVAPRRQGVGEFWGSNSFFLLFL